MQSIASKLQNSDSLFGDISKYQKRKESNTTWRTVNERSLIIKEFVDKLNADRVGTRYKPLSAGFVASKMSMMKIQALKEFLGDCNEASNFSKYWWWKTNPKNYK